MLTIKQVSEKIGLSDQAVYKQIREKRGVGKNFCYIPGKGYRYEFYEIKEEEEDAK